MAEGDGGTFSRGGEGGVVSDSAGSQPLVRGDLNIHGNRFPSRGRRDSRHQELRENLGLGEVALQRAEADDATWPSATVHFDNPKSIGSA